MKYLALIFIAIMSTNAVAEDKCCHLSYSITSKTGPESTATKSIDFPALPNNWISIALTPSPELKEDQLTIYFTEESDNEVQLDSTWQLDGQKYLQSSMMKMGEEVVFIENNKTVKIMVTKY